MTVTAESAERMQSGQGDAEILSLTDIFECSLGEAVFEEPGARIKVTKLRPMILRDANDVCYPGIVLAVEGSRYGNPFNHNRVDILLKPDGTNELAHWVRPKTFFEPLAATADMILEAFGFNRDAVFGNLDFERTLIVPKHIADALCEYVELETVPEWDNTRDQQLWDAALCAILTKTEGDRFIVNYSIKNGYSPELGDLYLISAVAEWKLYDAPDVPYKTFDPSEKLTRFQEQVLERFLAQSDSREQMLAKVNEDVVNLPDKLLKTAHQTLGGKEESRQLLIHRNCG